MYLIELICWIAALLNYKYLCIFFLARIAQTGRAGSSNVFRMFLLGV